MIPQEKSESVARALRAAFGVSEFEDIRAITIGNATSRVFRIVVRSCPFLLKIIMRTDDPTRHYQCMRAAAEAGLAPQVRYTSVEDRISITDFLETAPLPLEEALVRVPGALRKLHALAPFPDVENRINTSYMFLINKGSEVDAFIQRFRAANILPEADYEELSARYSEVAAVYPRRDPDMVSCHNDLFKPDNVLFDGRRVWLVDWEAAFRNDRYADLAVAANLLVNDDADEGIYLREYFGEAPDQYQLARLFLARQAAHIFYSMVFLFIGSTGKPIDWSEPIPSFDELRRCFWAGELDLKDSGKKIVYGRVHWERLLHNARQPRYKESLRILSDRRASA